MQEVIQIDSKSYSIIGFLRYFYFEFCQVSCVYKHGFIDNLL